MRGYPLLDLFWTMLYFFIWVLWIFLLVRIITDIFRSADLGGGAKAGWTVLLIVLPFIGSLAYLIFRGSDMHTRENRQVTASEDMLRHYARQAAGPGVSTADELHKLAALRDNGVLTEQEFAALKAKVLG